MRKPTKTGMTGMKPWVIYCRVSTEEQVIGHSLDNQEDICRRYAESKQWPVMKAIVDGGVSGKNLDRPGIQDVRHLAHLGLIGGVLVSKIDRLGRNLRDMLALVDELSDVGVVMQSALEPFETASANGKAMFSMRGIFAEWERNQCSERQIISQQFRRLHGFFTGGTIPSGFTTAGERGKRILQPDPIWGPIVARCWSMVEEGRSLRDCATYLQEQGAPNRLGGRWSTSTVSNLFTREWACNGLISRDQHERARAELRTRHSPQRARQGHRKPTSTPSPSGKTDRIWVLQGIARCAHCGAALVGTHGNGKGGKYHYLQCSGRGHLATGPGSCTAIRLPATAWEEAVVAGLLNQLRDDRNLIAAIARETAAWADQTAPLNERRTAAIASRDAADRIVSRLVRMAATSDLAERAVAEELAKAQARKETALQELALVDAELERARLGLGSTEEILALIRDGLAELASATPDEQRIVLRGLLAWVELGTTADDGPLPMRLGIRVPTLPTHPTKDSSQDKRGPGADRRRPAPSQRNAPATLQPATGTMAQANAGLPPGPDDKPPERPEPLEDSRGSDAHTTWRRRADSNRRYAFPRTTH